MTPLSKRQYKLIKRYARGKRLIKCREVGELIAIGLIGRFEGHVDVGRYASFPCLTMAGLEAARHVQIGKPVVDEAGNLIGAAEGLARLATREGVGS